MFIAEPFQFTSPTATPTQARSEITAFVALIVIALVLLAVLVVATGGVHVGHIPHGNTPHIAR